jgi:hypothetical protein
MLIQLENGQLENQREQWIEIPRRFFDMDIKSINFSIMERKYVFYGMD